nr:calcium permeable stress-gated cation channel 1-like [Tanacetum cinerariifolium]
MGLRTSPTASGAFVRKFVNLDYRSYLKFLNWVPDALRMSQSELIEHAGLDSAVYLRIYLLGLKIFVPIFLITWAVLIPVNFTNNTLELSKKNYSEIDKLSISNIPHGSPRLWAHVAVAYVVTIWTCFMLKKEYETVANMRFYFLQSEEHRPDQFTVLVKNIPPDAHESVSDVVQDFFLVNHHDNYLTHQVVCNANKLAKLVKKRQKKQNWLDYYQIKYSKNPSKRPLMKTGFWGLWGKKVDGIEHHETEIEKLTNEIDEERKNVLNDPKAILPAAFVSFKTRWGAAVCAQTQQVRNPTLWLTEWAPEPRDVYWKNLAIPYVSLTIRKVIMGVAFFFLTFFYMIPIAFVQSLANIQGIEKAVPFLKPIINVAPGFIMLRKVALSNCDCSSLKQRSLQLKPETCCSRDLQKLNLVLLPGCFSGDLQKMTTSVGNNSVFRSFFEKQKLTGPNFIAHAAWVKGQKEVVVLMLLTMDLEIQQNLAHLGAYGMLQELKAMYSKQAEQELLQTVREFHTSKQEDGQSVSSHVLKMKGYIENLERLGQPVGQNLAVSLILVSLNKDFDSFVQNYNMHGMGKTVNELHAMLNLHEETLPEKDANPALYAIRAGRVQKNQKNKSHKAGKGSHGKGKGKMGNASNNASIFSKPKTPPPPNKDNPAKDAICHQCGEARYWRRKCPVYLAELMIKKNGFMTLVVVLIFVLLLGVYGEVKS